MSSDLYPFDGSFSPNSNSELQFISDFSPFCDSPPPLDVLLSIPSSSAAAADIPIPIPIDQTTTHVHHLSCSPPIHEMENLSISQTSHFLAPAPVVDLDYDVSTFLPHYIENNNAEMIQQHKSCSSSPSCYSYSYREEFYQPKIEYVMNYPNFQNTHLLNLPENSFLSVAAAAVGLRKVFSTSDLQDNMRGALQMSPRRYEPYHHPTTTGTGTGAGMGMGMGMGRSFSLVDQRNFTVGRYSPQERRERVHKYRAKRSLRNFHKTIKYACRKTLADNRPRVRGRFARNDEIGETLDTAILIKDEEEEEEEEEQEQEEEDDLWVDGQAYEGTVRGNDGQFLNNGGGGSGGGGGGQFLNNFGHNQFHHYYGF